MLYKIASFKGRHTCLYICSDILLFIFLAAAAVLRYKKAWKHKAHRISWALYWTGMWDCIIQAWKIPIVHRLLFSISPLYPQIQKPFSMDKILNVFFWFHCLCCFMSRNEPCDVESKQQKSTHRLIVWRGGLVLGVLFFHCCWSSKEKPFDWARMHMGSRFVKAATVFLGQVKVFALLLWPHSAQTFPTDGIVAFLCAVVLFNTYMATWPHLPYSFGKQIGLVDGWGMRSFKPITGGLGDMEDLDMEGEICDITK